MENFDSKEFRRTTKKHQELLEHKKFTEEECDLVFDLMGYSEAVIEQMLLSRYGYKTLQEVLKKF